MSTDRELLEYIAAQVGKLTIDVDSLKKDVTDVKNKLDQKSDKTDIVRLENTHGTKIEALLDGYKQHSEQLNRIEEEVNKHDEVILRKVK